MLNLLRLGICNPVETYKINSYSKDTGFDIINTPLYFDNDKNILNQFTKFKKIKLYGIADDMPFILPNIYSIKHVKKQLLNNKN